MSEILRLVTPPAVEPVVIADAKAHLRRDDTTADDAYITNDVIPPARGHAERVTRRQLITATYSLSRRGFPAGPLWLPKPPLQSVSSITYVDTAGASQTWDASLYTVVAESGPTAWFGKVMPAYDQVYPTTRGHQGDLTVTFVCGYGDAGTDVPPEIILGIKHLMLFMYEHRGDALMDTDASLFADRLFWPYRALRW